jgi:parallel beta-helix repeat protein
MYNNTNSSPTLVNLTFSNNSANFGGGGMFNNVNSYPTLTNITFSNNSQTGNGGGGGMFNYTASPNLTNVTFSGNSADDKGGGIYNYSSSNPMLTNVTFSGNSANDTGGGMYNTSSSSPTIRNTIFWGNTAPSGAQIYNNSSTPILNNNVVQDGCPTESTCTNTITTDPLLGALGNYGGFTQTIPLLAGSSAINATNSNCPTSDQRGVIRSTPSCDIGAYEVSVYSIYLPLVIR